MPSATLMSSPSRLESSPDVTVAISSALISLATNVREMKAEEAVIAAFVRIAKVPVWRLDLGLKKTMANSLE